VGIYGAHTEQVPNTWDELRTALAEFDTRGEGKALNTHGVGNALKAVEGRVIDRKRLKRCGVEHNVTVWRLERV
jgi:hypothetical protein